MSSKGITCPYCHGSTIVKNGYYKHHIELSEDEIQKLPPEYSYDKAKKIIKRQRYKCNTIHTDFLGNSFICGKTFMLENYRKSKCQKELVSLLLYCNEYEMNEISDFFGVTEAAICNWHKRVLQLNDLNDISSIERYHSIERNKFPLYNYNELKLNYEKRYVVIELNEDGEFEKISLYK